MPEQARAYEVDEMLVQEMENYRMFIDRLETIRAKHEPLQPALLLAESFIEEAKRLLNEDDLTQANQKEYPLSIGMKGSGSISKTVLTSMVSRSNLILNGFTSDVFLYLFPESAHRARAEEHIQRHTILRRMVKIYLICGNDYATPQDIPHTMFMDQKSASKAAKSDPSPLSVGAIQVPDTVVQRMATPMIVPRYTLQAGSRDRSPLSDLKSPAWRLPEKAHSWEHEYWTAVGRALATSSAVGL
ncbi:hypothetical protein EDD37DRAFT_607616 [Exophiala viscosa]|uniref:uncharacterized protein n=1 Tax=Exophiala viscosa TaxID=2486360 RepID=UPI0021A1269B|nr:hypothetical protein EDD37DRAFT_607616 [Exophiala viscosa]